MSFIDRPWLLKIDAIDMNLFFSFPFCRFFTFGACDLLLDTFPFVRYISSYMNNQYEELLSVAKLYYDVHQALLQRAEVCYIITSILLLKSHAFDML